MGMLEEIGYPKVDEDGTLRVKAVEKDGMVELHCNGHAFVRCLIKDNNPIVQLIDIDIGIVHERDFGLLCWAR